MATALLGFGTDEQKHGQEWDHSLVNRMKIHGSNHRRGAGAFSLIEVIVCVAIISLIFVTLYGGIASGFGVVNLARENLRANQIIVEKMETIRLYNWDQINSNGFIPPTFTAPFFPLSSAATNSSLPISATLSEGLTYFGTMNITNAPVADAYATNMKLVTVTLTWTNGHILRTRQLQTLVSKDGMQNYIYY